MNQAPKDSDEDFDADESGQLQAEVDDAFAGQRLDQALAVLFSDFSRSRLQEWIRAGRVRVDGDGCKPKQRLQGGELIELEVLQESVLEDQPEPISLDIRYQDDDLLVINKPAGLVVHPAAGNPSGTLLNGLLNFDQRQACLPRAGLVHRLDKETSGLLVVARTSAAHRFLVEQLQAREIHREYRAIAQGVLTAGGKVDQPMGRHPVHRIRQAVVASGKPAVTHYRVLERYRGHSYLKVKLETGRTHQIRVHMAHIHHPLLGDPLYGGRLKLPAGAGDALRQGLADFRRQALHAYRLGLKHPVSGDWMEWQAELPGDMEQMLGLLRSDAADG